MQITPPGASSAGFVTLTLPDGSIKEGYICSYKCAEGYITLSELPRGAFLEARNANPTSFPYKDTETIEWSTNHLEEPVTFTYLPAPLHHIRPILEPFLNAYALNTWVWTIMGVIGASIFSWLRKKLGSMIKRDKAKDAGKESQDAPTQKAKLIISASGEEKEITISHKE